MTADEKLRVLVTDAIRNADENGYGDDIRAMTKYALAHDMILFDSDIEKFADDIGKQLATMKIVDLLAELL